MFAKIFTLFALIAVAFAAPKAEPEPKPQFLAAGVEYVSPYTAGLAAPPYVPYPAVETLAYPYQASPYGYFVR